LLNSKHEMNSNAILLLGHSNSGKTPLGEMIARGMSSPERKFLHLDFGENLRNIASGRIDAGLNVPDVAFVARILDGTLLDDPHFYIAEAVVRSFCRRHDFAERVDVLVLNGLPRHTGQVQSLESMGVNVLAVLFLDCSAQVAGERKRMADSGAGHEDRGRRGDGDHAVFEKKIASFEKETRPLIDYYKSRLIPVVELPITAATTPGEAFNAARPFLEAAVNAAKPG
jgi:adenylate kinase family enzyme